MRWAMTNLMCWFGHVKHPYHVWEIEVLQKFDVIGQIVVCDENTKHIKIGRLQHAKIFI